MTIKEQIAAAQAALVSAGGALTPAEQEIETDRAQLATVTAQLAERRAHELAKRVDTARAELGPKVPVTSIDFEADSPGAGTVVIRWPGAAATKVYRVAVNKAMGATKDTEAAERAYACASIYDHNGNRDIAPPAIGENASAFMAILTDRTFIAPNIVNVVGKLGGLAAEERKS